MQAITKRLLIGFGTESGNAQLLAEALRGEPSLQAYAPEIKPLGEIDPCVIPNDQALVIISSSFGDGEPPANAEPFLIQLQQIESLPNLRYAIFGLGDTGYPNFCGFTKRLDKLLQERQAQSLVQRVDADACYPDFFSRWRPVLCKVLQGDLQAGQDLLLRVTAYGASNAYAAPILERRQLNDGEPGAFHLRLDTTGSGMVWRAGDTLHVLPENDPQLLTQLANWYGAPEAAVLLKDKELRQLSKGVLRELARLGGSEELKGLLKISQRKKLEDYLWGADLLDLLEDFCTPQNVSLADLSEILSPCLPRAYSIASHGQAGYIDLCLREVVYRRNGRRRHGVATRWLLQHDGPIRMYCRSNPGFHLTKAANVPLILVGTGTGIAPLMGLLREMQVSGQQRDSCLVFGEKYSDHDFLYEDEISGMRSAGVLGELITAFSRDGKEKYYVQHAITRNADRMRSMLERGAHIYICGNKRHLEKSLGTSFDAIAADMAGLPADDTGWQMLTREGRVHQELY